MAGVDSDPKARTLYDDWQVRRARLADVAAEGGGPADYHVVELRLLDYLLRRYRGAPEAARPARFPLSTTVFVDHRALTVHHHLGRGLIPTITSADEALAHVRSIVDRMRSPAAAGEAGEPDEAVAAFTIPPPADPAEAARTRLCSGEAAVRLRAALELGKIGTLDDVGLLSDLLSLPAAPDEHPRERAAILYAMQKLSGQEVEPFDPPAVPTRAEELRVQHAREQMTCVIRLYRWMGVVGAAISGMLAIWLCIDWTSGEPSLPAEYAAILCFYVVSALAFPASLTVAHRLATDPEGMLPRARLVGIILAAAWFPLFTLPAIFCVRMVTEQFGVYCESFRRIPKPEPPRINH
jgi:hypothetical protein